MRGTLSAIAVVATVAVLAPPVNPTAEAAGNFQGDSAHSGVADSSISSPLRRLWSHELDGFVRYPVIGDGRAFTTTVEGTVWAFDLATGRELWRQQVTREPFVYAAYENGRVFVGGDGARLQALDAATGNVLWSALVPAPGLTAESAPVVRDGTVYVVGDSLGTGHGLYAVDAATGGLRWFQGLGPAGDDAMPAVDERAVYVSRGCDSNLAFDRASGARLWTVGIGCSDLSPLTPTVGGRRVYLRALGGSGAIVSAASGARLGSFASVHPPALPGELAVIAEGTALRARDASGNVLWEAADRTATPGGGPLVTGSEVFVPGHTLGSVYGYDLASGRRTWSSFMDNGGLTSARIDTSGLAAAGDVLVVSAGGWLHALGPARVGPNAVAIEARARRREILWHQSARIEGRVSDLDGQATVELQARPRGRGPWTAVRQSQPLPDGRFAFEHRPRRNTSYRVVMTSARPVVSGAFRVLAGLTFGARYVLYPGGTVIGRLRVSGPREVRLGGKRMYVYLFRRGARRVVRVASGRLRRSGRGRTFRARVRFRVSDPRRSDRLLACYRERRDDGFGRHDRSLRLCGRRTISLR
jgi:outer membrane protein assembly factor BamB